MLKGLGGSQPPCLLHSEPSRHPARHLSLPLPRWAVVPPAGGRWSSQPLTAGSRGALPITAVLHLRARTCGVTQAPDTCRQQAVERLPRARAAQEEENESEPKMRSRKELLRSGSASPKTQGQREGQVFLGKLEAGASSLAPDNQSNPSFRSFRFCEHPTAASPPPETGTQEVNNWTEKKKKICQGRAFPRWATQERWSRGPQGPPALPPRPKRPRRSGACAPAAGPRRAPPGPRK